MKTEYLEIVCPQCFRHYGVIRTGAAQRRQRLAIDYAICPFCYQPRRQDLWQGRDLEQRCSRCGLPPSVVKFDRQKLCHPCYQLLHKTGALGPKRPYKWHA